MTQVKKAATFPKNYPVTPARYPLPMFRLQLEAARRYLFEGELLDTMKAANIPLEVLNPNVDVPISVTLVAQFMRELKEVIGDDQARTYGRDAFHKVSPLLPRATGPQLSRAVSTPDKLFLKVRDSIAVLNRQCGSNFMVKWHGGAEADIFEDSGQHCYGYTGNGLACQALTGYLEEAIAYLSGVKMSVTESECMVTGALACRWHCKLA